MRRTAFALAVPALVAAAPAAEAKARPTVKPLFVVSQADSAAYLLGCARVEGTRTSFVAGGACARALARQALALEVVAGDQRKPLAIDKAAFAQGAACPGPSKRRFPHLTLDPATTLAHDALLVSSGARTLAVASADATQKLGIDAALAHATKRQKARARSPGAVDTLGPTVVGLVDVDGNGTFEIVVRDTSLVLLYGQDGKPLAGEVGCYFGG